MAKKTSEQLELEIAKAKESLKELQKAKRIKDRQDKAEREKIERQKRINEAVELIEYSKECNLQSGQTIYDYLKTSYENKQKAMKMIQQDASSATGALRTGDLR